MLQYESVYLTNSYFYFLKAEIYKINGYDFFSWVRVYPDQQ